MNTTINITINTTINTSITTTINAARIIVTKKQKVLAMFPAESVT